MISSIKTNTGRVRANNEDAYYIPKDERAPALYIVADGMGGHQGGEIASQIAVEEVSDHINSCFLEAMYNNHHQKIKELLRASLDIANAKILELSRSNEDWSGMGTTITLALFCDDHLYIGHVGDSRAYRVRNNSIKQLTKDHSLVHQLLEEGRLTEEEAKTHPMKNVITKALGTDEVLRPDILDYSIQVEDIIILCSDGLTNMLDDDYIKRTVCSHDPDEATEKLIENANLRGGDDNITVGVIKVKEVGLGRP